MDRELQEYYEAAIYTTNTPGWEFMVQDAKNDMASLNSVPHIKDAQHLFTTQGRIRELEAFIQFKDTLRVSYEKLLADDVIAAENKRDGEQPNEAEIV